MNEKFANLSFILDCEYFFCFCYFSFVFLCFLFAYFLCLVVFGVFRNFGCMHRKPTSELFTFDPELQKT